MRRADKAYCAVFLFVIALFCSGIGLRFVTVNVLVERLGMDNAFTDLVLSDGYAQAVVEGAVDGGEETESVGHVEIDWPKAYPFAGGGVPRKKAEGSASEEAVYGSPYESLVGAAKSRIETYANDLLIGRQAMLELGSAYDALTRWNYVSYGEYNGIVETEDGYLTTVYPRLDVRDFADAVSGLARECAARGKPFLYVAAPFKVCEEGDAMLTGGLDFSNQNMDDLVSRLREGGVEVLDLREAIHGEGLSHHGLFYRTDHHWLPSTGLWATRRLAALLNDRYGLGLDLARIASDEFSSIVYPDWFLGSQGKKVTLLRAKPEDFELLYPKHATSLRYRVPSLGVDEVGDFSVLYDMRQVEVRDFYGKNPYGAYIYADQPLETIENLDAAGGPHVLVVHDSFANCVVPCLSLAAGRVDSIDLRHFDGSLQAYIESEDPDAVVVMYTRTRSDSEYDFR